eukprot:1179555-Prorocentrum_minimum.AAC.2
MTILQPLPCGVATVLGIGAGMQVTNQSQGTREHIPRVGTNHRGLESIYLQTAPCLASPPPP